MKKLLAFPVIVGSLLFSSLANAGFIYYTGTFDGQNDTDTIKLVWDPNWDSLITTIFVKTDASYVFTAPNSPSSASTPISGGGSGSVTTNNDGSFGSGNVVIDINGSGSGSSDNSGTVTLPSVGLEEDLGPQNGQGDADYSVKFEYTEKTTVPEPSSILLLGLGLIGLVARRRTVSKSA